MRNEISAKHEAVCVQLRAEALIVAVRWAGSASRLAALAGMTRYAGSQWLRRGAIPPGAALLLARVPDFPLSAEDMAPGARWEFYRPRRCNKCGLDSYPPGYRPGSSPMLKPRIKRSQKQPANHARAVKSTPRKSTSPAAD